MATYQEIKTLAIDSDLQEKVEVATVVKAHGLISGITPTQAQIDWASSALGNPKQTAEGLLFYVLADNKAATIEQIQGASDSDIQTAVDTAVDAMIAGGA